MPKLRIRGGIALSAFALTALALTGCSQGSADTASESTAASSAPAQSSAPAESSAPAASGEKQSTADACTALQTQLTDSANELQKGMTEIQNDPDAALTSLKGFKSSLDDSIASLNNDEVAKAATDISDYFDKMITKIDEVTADPKNTQAQQDLMAMAGDAGSASAELTKVCGG